MERELKYFASVNTVAELDPFEASARIRTFMRQTALDGQLLEYLYDLMDEESDAPPRVAPSESPSPSPSAAEHGGARVAYGRAAAVRESFTEPRTDGDALGPRRALAREGVEGASDHLEDLGAGVLREAVADHVAAARRFDRAGVAQHADVLARRGRGAIDDTREIARGEGRLREGADDLDPRQVADALDELARLALLSRRRSASAARPPPRGHRWARHVRGGALRVPHSLPLTLFVASSSHRRKRFRSTALARARNFNRRARSPPCAARPR